MTDQIKTDDAATVVVVPREHKLKTHSIYWDAVNLGQKTFEVRRDDRGFQCGDVLVLQKFDPRTHRYVMDSHVFDPKPIEIRRVISCVLTGGQFGIEPGFVVLALADELKDKRIAGLELAARDAADLLDQLWMETRSAPRSLIPILTAANKLNAAIGRPQSPHGKQF